MKTRRLVVNTSIDVPDDMTLEELSDTLAEAKWRIQDVFPDEWNADADVQTVISALLLLGLGSDTDPEVVPDLDSMGYGEALRHLANGGEIRLTAKNLR